MDDKSKRKKTDSQPPAAEEPATDRSADRHTSGFMVRLPEVYRTQLRKYQQQYRSAKKFRPPPMADIVRVALEQLLAEEGLWPPSPAP